MSRHQLPAYSPLTLRSIASAAFDCLSPTARVQESLLEYLSVRFHSPSVVLTASGTQALELSLRIASASTRGDCLVALPAYSCYDLGTAAVGAGLPVTFFDLDPITLSPVRESVRRALEEGATTVVVGNLFGFPLDWTGVLQECREAGAVVVEDAAQGLGTMWGDQAGGTFGDLTVLSFGRGKGWTGGGGGALLVRSEPFSEQAEVYTPGTSKATGSLRNAILSVLQWSLGRPALFGLPNAIPGVDLGETRYKTPTPVQAIPSFSAALVSRTANLAEGEARLRKEKAGRLRNLLESSGEGRVFCTPAKGGESSFLRLPFLSDNAGVHVTRELSVMGVARGYPLPLPDLPHLVPVLRRPRPEVPGARRLAERLLTLPTHSLLASRDFRILREVFGEPA